MFQNITLAPVLGLPAIAWGGMATFLLLIVAAVVGAQATKGKATLKMHKLLVIIGLALALIHAVLGILAFI